MAEVIGRSGLIGSGYTQQQRRHRSPIGVFGATGVRVVNRFPSVKLKASGVRSLTGGDFLGRRIGGGDHERLSLRDRKRGNRLAVNAQLTGGIIGKGHKWWEKGIQPNMKEVTSAQDTLPVKKLYFFLNQLQNMAMTGSLLDRQSKQRVKLIALLS